jgi:hypothetical protein
VEFGEVILVKIKVYASALDPGLLLLLNKP